MIGEQGVRSWQCRRQYPVTLDSYQTPAAAGDTLGRDRERPCVGDVIPQVAVCHGTYGRWSHVLQEQDVGILVSQQFELIGRMGHAAYIPACDSQFHVNSIRCWALSQKHRSGVI